MDSIANKYNMETAEVALNFWQKLSEAINDENGLRSLHRVVNNAKALSMLMESNGILTEANDAVHALQTLNQKISMSTHNRAIDNVLVFVFLKSLLTVPSRTKAYRLGLIDNEGKLIKQPKTKDEHDCISNLDLLMFKMRKWLAPKMQYLSTVSWVKGAGSDGRVQNSFSNAETIARQYMITRLNRDLEKLLDKG